MRDECNDFWMREKGCAGVCVCLCVHACGCMSLCVLECTYNDQ